MEYLAVDIEEDGVVHVEDGKLIVGDFDIVKAAIDAWGGNRQRGSVRVVINLRNRSLTNTSPDFNGKYCESSEPNGGLG